jgi:hypothetical protein
MREEVKQMVDQTPPARLTKVLEALVPEEGGDPWVPEEVYAGGRTIRIPKWQGWAKGAKEKLDAMLQETAA